MQKSRSEIQRDNLENQLLKLRKQTEMAVQHAREAANDRKQLIEQSDKLKVQIANHEANLGWLVNAIEELEAKRSSTLTSIKQSEQKSSKRQVQLQQQARKLLLGMEDTKSEIQRLREIRTTLVKEIETLVAEHDQSQSKQDEAADKFEEDRSAMSQELERLQQEILDAQIIREAVIQEYKDWIIKADEEKKQHEKQETKLLEAANRLKEKQEKQEIREKDFNIISKRLQKKYEEEFPGRKLNI